LENNNKFITIVTKTSDKETLRIEIIPQQVRKTISNCSHIDFNIESGRNLFEIIKSNSKLKILEKTMDQYYDIVSEFYFFNLDDDLHCYSNINLRHYQKQNDAIYFGDLLLQRDKNYCKNKKSKKKTNH